MCVNGIKTENKLIEHNITDYLKLILGNPFMYNQFIFNKSAPIEKIKEYIFN